VEDQPINKTMCFDSNIPHPATPHMASEIVAGQPALPAKARFCVKCKIYIPINYFVTDDGTVSESVCNRHELEKTLDMKGVRYCKVCDNYIALDLFPRTGAMSYICKKLKYASDVARRSKETEGSHPGKKRRLRQWKMCWADSRKFKQASLGMSENEVDLEIAKIDRKGTGEYRIMPIDAGKMMTTENCIAVTVQKRKKLMKMIATDDLEGYAKMITEMEF